MRLLISMGLIVISGIMGMIIDLKENDVYVPVWNNNKKLDESEQIKVHYKYLSKKEMQKCIVITRNKGKVDADFDTDTFLELSIIKIENLKSTNNKEIKTGNDLLETGGLTELCAEVLTNIQAASAIDKKK